MGKPELAYLMSQYCQGESAAFTKLYELLSPALLGYLTKMSGNRPAAEDLLQQTFLKVHRSRGSYIKDADPTPWIYAIAHRTFIDAYRKKERSKVHLTRDGELRSQAADITGQNEATKSEAPDADVMKQAMKALDQLSPTQKQAVVLVKLQSKTIQEAAEIAGTTQGAMKVRAHRGYAALRAQLTKAMGDG